MTQSNNRFIHRDRIKNCNDQTLLAGGDDLWRCIDVRWSKIFHKHVHNILADQGTRLLTF